MRGAFTAVEMGVVIVIMAILAAIILPICLLAADDEPQDERFIKVKSPMTGNKIEIVELEGHRFAVITSNGGVAICLIPKGEEPVRP